MRYFKSRRSSPALRRINPFGKRSTEKSSVRGSHKIHVEPMVKNNLFGIQMMERLTQVTKELEEIVQITQGKKPADFVLNESCAIHKTDRNGKAALLDAYRSIALISLSHGRYAQTAYSIGKHLGHGLKLNSDRELDEMLEQLGVHGVHHQEPSGHIQLDRTITSRGVHHAEKPVCFLEAGLLAGLLGNMLQKKVEMVERKCYATGDQSCVFELLDAEKLSDSRKSNQAAALLSEGYAEENLKLLTTLASHALTAIDNTLLFEKTRRQAVIDSLTEIFNHRYFQEMIRVELKRSHRHHHPVSLVMIDVDHFKSFNDRYGHPKGDGLLKRIARFLKSSVRDIDIVARYGGDEFAFILPQTDARGAVRIADRIRKSEFIGQFRCRYPDVKLGFTFGIKSTNGEKVVEAQKFIAQADKALLLAKRKGSQRIGLARSIRTIQFF